jgi:AcrR family transcriptional regulator
MSQAASASDARDLLLDAAERLLVRVGHAGITTRRVAQEAGVNHGLVHYYFGSIENLLAETLNRFTGGLIERQRAMYETDAPFIEKWRTAMRYMDEDQASGYQKIWLELHALAWNNPHLRTRVAKVTSEWRRVLRDALVDATREYGFQPDEIPIAAITALIETLSLGMMIERHVGVTEGQQELLAEIELRLGQLEGRKRDAGSSTRHRRPRRA